MVKLIFLGTGGWVSPANRGYVSILIRPNRVNSLYVLDFGEGAFKSMQRLNINPLAIKAVFISHIHGDHILGLPGLLINLKAYGYDDELKIVAPENSIEFLEKILETLGESRIRYEIIRAKAFRTVYSDENVSVEAFPAKHPIETLMYKITLKSEGKTVFYSSDTSPFNKLLEFIKGSNILIYEASFLEGFEKFAHSKGHSTVKDAITLALKLKIQSLIVFHIGFYLKLPKKVVIDSTSVYFPDDGDELLL